MCWLICYDISDTGKRGKVAKYISRIGMRIQKSVFLVDDSQDIENHIDNMSRICCGEGVLSAYPLHGNAINMALCLGKQTRIQTFKDFMII